MTTVALLRQNYVNSYLRRADVSTFPWLDAQVDRAITDALTDAWDDGLGSFATGTVATSEASDLVTLPAPFSTATDWRLSRIELEQTAGGVTGKVDRVPNWRRHSATQVRIAPMLATFSGLVLRFYGWVPFSVTASDLPVRLEKVIAYKALALAYAQELGNQANAQTQINVDNARALDFQTLTGLSAYWERRYQDALGKAHELVSVGPRRSRR